MSANGTITHIWTSPAPRRAMVGHSQIDAVVEHGLADCAHARPKGKRQVLLVESEILEQFHLQPGQIKENITTQGIRLQESPSGTLLQLGDAVVLEITGDCEPCREMDRIRAGLEGELRGKRGMLARVLEGGQLRVGDCIRIL